MTGLIFLIIILGAGIGILLIFIIKSLIAPKRVALLQTLLKQGKTQAAIKAAKSIIAKEPRNQEAHYFLGQAYMAEGKPELALMEYKTVNQIGIFGPTVPELDFRKRMAQIFIKFNQIEEALKEYLLLVKLDGNQADYYYWCGKLFSDRDRNDMALNYLRKAVEIDPRHGKAHQELGLLLFKDKKAVEAKAELEAALKYEPENLQTYYYLGKLQKDSHDYVAALLSFEKAQRDPDFRAKALVERGGCYMSMNALDKAVPELERAVKASSDDASSEVLYGRYFLAMCHERMRNLDKAIEQWEKIYAKKPSFRDVAEKLSHYQEYRTDDKMKDYLSTSREEFVEICKSIVLQGMSLQIRDVSEVANGCDIVAVEGESAKWLNARKMPRLIRFMRAPEMVDDGVVRGLMEMMKKIGMTRAVLVTSSNFSRTAIEFADSRPIDLVNKDQLTEMLNNVDIYGTAKRS